MENAIKMVDKEIDVLSWLEDGYDMNRVYSKIKNYINQFNSQFLTIYKKFGKYAFLLKTKKSNMVRVLKGTALKKAQALLDYMIINEKHSVEFLKKSGVSQSKWTITHYIDFLKTSGCISRRKVTGQRYEILKKSV